ncbi:MAG: FAD binding domain-containing protein, partial [Rhizobacter sp.]|nr:FAD binding domain-containing protein [Rhizobacter sp.]
DIGALAPLRGISVEGGTLRLGALATHAEIESSPLVAEHAPLLSQAAPHIAHRAIRNLGTLGGSLAYADPAAEWPACMLALDATLVLAGAQGERRIAARDFFTGLYATALHADELIVACEVPVQAPDERQEFDELARRHGDYAIAGLAARALLRNGRLHDVRLALLGVDDRPVRAARTEKALQGRAVDDETLTLAVQTLSTELQPAGDLTSGPDTKRHLAGVLLRRVLRRLAG